MSLLARLKERFLSPEFLRFCIVGVLATAINYGVYYLCLSFTNPTIAYTLGYAISFICNFFLTAKFTFKKKAGAYKSKLKQPMGWCTVLVHQLFYLYK